MYTVLVPTDFSDSAKMAAEYAAQLAAKLNGNLLLFHAYMLPTPVSEMPYVLTTAEAIQQENEAAIAQEAERLHHTYNIQTEWLVRVGIPSSEIQVITEERTISLIVMGMKGENAIEKLIGSTTTNTMKKVSTPLLVVPENSRFQPIRNITLAVNYGSETPPPVFAPLLKLAQTFGSSLNIINITTENAARQPESLAGKIGLDPMFRDIPRQYLEIHDTKISGGIQQFVNSHPTDLLVMVSQTHSFFERLFGGSQTRKMAFETHVPFLVLSQKH